MADAENGADVRRKERLALAQAEQDIESIRSGRKRFTADYQLVDGPAPNDETAPRGEMASRTRPVPKLGPFERPWL